MLSRGSYHQLTQAKHEVKKEKKVISITLLEIQKWASTRHRRVPTPPNHGIQLAHSLAPILSYNTNPKPRFRPSLCQLVSPSRL